MDLAARLDGHGPVAVKFQFIEPLHAFGQIGADGPPRILVG